MRNIQAKINSNNIEINDYYKTTIKNYLQMLLISVCNFSLSLEVNIKSYRLGSMEIYINNEDGTPIFGSELDISYEAKHIWSTNEYEPKKLRINQGSCGMISREDNIGHYYADILKGQIWLNEKEFCDLLDCFDSILTQDEK